LIQKSINFKLEPKQLSRCLISIRGYQAAKMFLEHIRCKLIFKIACMNSVDTVLNFINDSAAEVET